MPAPVSRNSSASSSVNRFKPHHNTTTEKHRSCFTSGNHPNSLIMKNVDKGGRKTINEDNTSFCDEMNRNARTDNQEFCSSEWNKASTIPNGVKKNSKTGMKASGFDKNIHSAGYKTLNFEGDRIKDADDVLKFASRDDPVSFARRLTSLLPTILLQMAIGRKACVFFVCGRGVQLRSFSSLSRPPFLLSYHFFFLFSLRLCPHCT